MGTAEAIERIFDNPHYTKIRDDEGNRLAWALYLSPEGGTGINNLLQKASELFRSVQDECGGVLTFIPGPRVWSEGCHRYVDFSGKGKRGMPVSWGVNGSDALWENLNKSSDVEMEIWRRVNRRYRGESSPFKGYDDITKGVTIYGIYLSPRVLAKTFMRHARDFGETNGMPRVVESAFNHISALGKKLRVVGFPYPHKRPRISLG
jgi:hypothetical protein